VKPIIIAYNYIHEAVLEDLSTDYTIIHFENNETLEDAHFRSALKKAVGTIGLSISIDKHLLDNAPNLKIVSNVSVGYDNLDLTEITKRNIFATNTPDVLNDTTADAIFGLLLATARRIPEMDQLVKSGNWDRSITVDQFGSDVHHKKLGIIGMGRIGQAIAKRARLGFDMEIFYHNRSRKLAVENELDASYVSMQKLLTESDFVCLMVPATKETQNMIGKNEFALMKESAIFINGSRGQNVDEDALLNALQSGKIHAAGTDVYAVEPIPANHPLLKCRNLVTLPHIGSATIENERKMAQLAAHNLKTGLSGSIPPNLINKND